MGTYHTVYRLSMAVLAEQGPCSLKYVPSALYRKGLLFCNSIDSGLRACLRFQEGLSFTIYYWLGSRLSTVRYPLVENRKVANDFCSVEKQMVFAEHKQTKSLQAYSPLSCLASMNQFYIELCSKITIKFWPSLFHWLCIGFSHFPPFNLLYHPAVPFITEVSRS